MAHVGDSTQSHVMRPAVSTPKQDLNSLETPVHATRDTMAARNKHHGSGALLVLALARRSMKIVSAQTRRTSVNWRPPRTGLLN